MSETKVVRRTQEQRTAETRGALFEAAVRAISRLGYSRASNAEIADEAGVSRGAITHHFTIAEVVRWVFQQEVVAYQDLQREWGTGSRVSDWPQISWEVLSRPSGVAVLEIFVASRSDPELAALIKPVQAEIEELAVTAFLDRLGAKVRDTTAIRLVVWAMHGMSIGRNFIDDPNAMRDSVILLSNMLERLAPNGTLEELLGSPPPS
jgi:AcrR family transcriptional regulator